MEKMHPNSFVTFKASWHNENNENDALVEVNVPINRITLLEKFQNSLRKDNANYVCHVLSGTCINLPKTEKSKHISYQIDKENYLMLKNILLNVDWRKADEDFLSKIITEQVKEEIIKTKHSSPIMSLEIE